eukprot:TRINITY_DN34_c0_g1_i1.p3 TRINITY_DN34_c0_g1~~TRINITY_DN34_c0_g1_i1.p3  ORF type:complete len:181 (+),score=69.32 TRINITY_DN34_c0_g1_i1:107-649(+)
MGFNMRVFLFVLLVASATAFKPEEPSDFKNILDLVQGFFDGLDQDKEFTHINDCLSQIDPVVEKIQDLIAYIKEVDEKWDPSKIFKVLSKICDTCKEILLTIKPCVKIGDDLQKLIEKIKNIDFDAVMKGLVLKAVTVFGLITQAIEKYKEGDFRGCGYAIGEAIYMVFFQKDEEKAVWK